MEILQLTTPSSVNKKHCKRTQKINLEINVMKPVPKCNLNVRGLIRFLQNLFHFVPYDVQCNVCVVCVVCGTFRGWDLHRLKIDAMMTPSHRNCC